MFLLFILISVAFLHPVSKSLEDWRGTREDDRVVSGVCTVLHDALITGSMFGEFRRAGY